MGKWAWLCKWLGGRWQWEGGAWCMGLCVGGVM